MRQTFRARILSRSKRYAYIARWASFLRQSYICLEQEMTIEEVKRRFPRAVGVKIGYSVYQPMEVNIHV